VFGVAVVCCLFVYVLWFVGLCESCLGWGCFGVHVWVCWCVILCLYLSWLCGCCVGRVGGVVVVILFVWACGSCYLICVGGGVVMRVLL